MSGEKLIVVLGLLVLIGCGSGQSKTNETVQTIDKSGAPQVTFVELGSVNCIPCKAMVPVMAAVEHKFGAQLKVEFHDVKKEPQYGRQYGIRLIPTQVFLDRQGTEFFRHEGFFPEAAIDSVLQSHGLEVVAND